MRKAASFVLSPEDEVTLKRWSSAGTTEARLARRARIVLAAAKGTETRKIAAELSERPSTVSKWRLRFARLGMDGINDQQRLGPPRRYDEEEVTRRILEKLGQTPPKGFSQWNGRLLAESMSDVSEPRIRRTLRRQKIQLQRKVSWCISTDPEFGPKAADIVALYLHPPENAVVVCVDEKPHVQALERAQGYLRLPNGQALRGVAHEYKRHGTTTLFAALNWLTGKVFGMHTKRRRRREFLDFMNEVIAQYPGMEIHVILDNLSTHKPKHDRWLQQHPNVHLHFTPTHASWLNMIECWFSILSRSALRGASFTSPRQVRDAIDDFIAQWQENGTPFEWTKTEVHPVSLKHYSSYLETKY